MRGSLILLTGLLSLFAAVLGYGIWLGLEIECGCFGLGGLGGDGETAGTDSPAKAWSNWPVEMESFPPPANIQIRRRAATTADTAAIPINDFLPMGSRPLEMVEVAE